MSRSPTSDDADEPSLIRAAARGDAVAFARLYDRYVKIVTRRLSHLLGPSGRVDDLLQETFLRVTRALPRFRAERPFRHWLLRVATSVVRDEQRRARRSLWRLFAQPEQIDEALASDGCGAERYPDLVAVHRALAQLSPRLREVIILFELEGATLAEIADELDIPLHTVASRLRRGRERLRTLLQHSGYADLMTAVPMIPLRGRT
jgi:RNA polymerase sigma-70 factor (ECF subfamily)